MEIKGMKKRVLAFVLAAATALTSWSVDWNAISVQAAASSVSQLSASDVISSGGYIGQVYTNDGEGYRKITAASIAAYIPTADGAVTYTINAYAGLTDLSDPTSGTKVGGGTTGTLSGSASETKISADTALSGIVLAPGESAGITARLVSSTGDGDVRYYYSASGSDGYISYDGSTWSGLGGDTIAITTAGAEASDLPKTTLSITSGGSAVTDIAMAPGDSVQLSATQDPAYNREVTFSGVDTNDAVEVSTSGLVTAANVGSETVTASTGLTQDVDASVNIHVVDATISKTSYTYTGNAIEPADDITVTCDSTLAAGTDYTLSYSADHTNVGTATVTVTGLGVYAGYTKTLEYEIVPLSISDMASAFAAGSTTIDTATSTVTASTGVPFNNSSLGYGTDYTATAAIKSRNLDSNNNVLNYVYTVTFTGQGNFADSVSVDVPVDVAAGLQLSDFYTIELADDELEYDGTAQEPDIIVYDRNGNEISMPSHMKVEYVPTGSTPTDGNSKPIGPGDAQAVITSSIYSGTVTLNYKIVQNLHTYKDSFSVTLQASSIDANGIYWPYLSGTEITPGVTVKKGTALLTAGTDYEVSYTNNTGSATDTTTATITITGKNYYTGKLIINFKIVPDISTAVVYFGSTAKKIDKTKPASSANSFRSSYAATYTGSQIQLPFELRIGGQKLTAGTDYDYVYGTNTAAGYGYVTITTKGDDYGVQSITAYFVIAPQELSDSHEIVINEGDSVTAQTAYKTFTTYRGTTIELPLYNSETGYGYSVEGLTLGSDYTIGFSNNLNAGTAVVTATGTGNYTGSISASFKILQRDLSASDSKTAITVDDVSYTGLALTPAPTVTVTPDVANNTTTYTLTQNSDFTVSYKNNIATADKTATNAPTVTVTGIGNYTGTKSATFSIIPRSLLSTTMSYYLANELVGTGSKTGATSSADELTFASTYSKEFTGNSIRPYIYIKDGDNKLSASKDYTYTIENSNKVGTATAVITGKGNYADTGTVYITFTVSQVDLNDSSRITIEQNDTSTKPTFKITDISIDPTLRTGGVLWGYTDDDTEYDYVVTYDTSTGAGEKTATITGHGNYKGTVKKTYTVGTNLAAGTIKIEDPTSTLVAGGDGTTQDKAVRIYYLGNNRPDITVSDKNGNELALTTDYTLSYEAISGNGYDAGSVVCVTATAASTSEQVFGEQKAYYYIEPAKLDMQTTIYNYILKVEGETVDYNSGFTYAYAYQDGTITPNIGLSYFPYKASAYTAHDGSNHAFSAETAMTAGTDYDITLPDPATISGAENSTGTIFTLTAKGNYTGTANITFTVGKRDFSKVTVVPSTIEDQYYTGSAIEPEVAVYDGDTELTRGTDYEIVYSDNTDVTTTDNPAKISITAKTDSHYVGNKTLTFNIVKETLNSTNTTVTIGAKKEYTGSAITLDSSDITVIYLGKELTLGTDYTLSYENNVNPGTATVTINGTGLYASSATAPPTGTFPIYLNLEKKTLYSITGLDSNNEYTFELASTKWTKKNGGGTLTNDGVGIAIGGSDTGFKLNTNFTVTKNGMSVPGETGNIKITGTGADQFCAGSVTIPTKVYGDIKEAKWSIAEYYLYDGTEQKPVPTLKYNGSTISDNCYTLKYSQAGNNFTDVMATDAANKRTLTIEGDSAHYFTGEASADYYIYYDITNATVSGIAKSYSFSEAPVGGAVPTVIAGSGSAQKTLVKGTDYTVTYQSSIATDSSYNSSGATITVSIDGIDKRSIGSQVITYTVTGATLNNSTTNWSGGTLGTLNDDATYSETYTGKEHTPDFGTVTYRYNNGAPVTLVKDKDYIVSWSNNVNAGTKTAIATLTGIGNYSGSMSKYFSIGKKDLSKAANAADIDPDVEDVSYAGGANVTPTAMSLYDTATKKTLNLGSDFTITKVTNNNAVTNSANVTVKITDTCTNYTGEYSTTFNIVPLDLTDASLAISDTSSEYTGSAITPKLTITIPIDSSGTTYTLVQNKDYKVSYNNSESMVDVGEYEVVISPYTDDGNVINFKQTKYEVTPKTLSEDSSKYTITYKDPDGNTISGSSTWIFPYTGEEVKLSSITITDATRGVTLTEGTDYTIEYANNTASTDAATLTITGTGNYGGEIVKTFKIGTDISDNLTVTLEEDEYPYDGAAHKPKPIVKSNGKLLTEDTDYTVSYYNSADTADDSCIAVGTWVVKVDSAGNGYYGSVTKEYTIVRKAANKDNILIKVTDSAFKQDSEGIYYTTYTGSEIEPEIEVYDTEISKKDPLDPSEYSVSYKNNVNAGNKTAVIVVTLGDNYTTTTGTIEQAFTINPLALGENTTIKVVYSDETGSESDRYYAYTGKEITPTVVITHKNGDDVITLDPADYTLYMTDDGTENGTPKNIAPGEAPIIAVGKRNFTGTTYGKVTATFDIAADLETAFDISDDNTVSINTQFYSGSAIDPAITATIEGVNLVQGTDFTTTTYAPSTYTTEGGVPVEGQVDMNGNSRFYVGTYTATFKISTEVDELLEITGLSDATYTGRAIKPEYGEDFVIVDPNGAALPASSIGTVTYESDDDNACIAAGTVTVSVPVEVDGDTYTLTKDFEIKPAAIGSANISYISSVTYTGVEKTANLRLTYNGKTLVEGADGDYEVTYSDNIYPGEASFVVRGKGNFDETTTASGKFRIEVQAMRNVTATPSGTNSIYVTWDKKNYVNGYRLDVVDSSNNIVKSYIVNNRNTTSYTATGLGAGGSYSIHLMGYVDANSQRYYGQPTSVTTYTDIAAPTVTATSNYAGAATLTLPAIVDDGAYAIYRSTEANGNYKPIIKLATGVSSYTDTNLTSGETYYYIACLIKVINDTIISSEPSDAVAITVN